MHRIHPGLVVLLLVLPGLRGQAVLLHGLHGDSAGDTFGAAVAGVGDVDGDGHDDLLVGSPRDSTLGYLAGKAELRSGQDGSVLHTFLPTTTTTAFGAAVAFAGDVNGDGHGDFIVGQPETNTSGAGRVHVYSGLDGSLIYQFVGDAFANAAGTSVAGAGDVNGDGHADIVVGIPGNSSVASNCGAVRVYSGADGSILWTRFGNAITDNLGLSVAGGADYDLDGLPDVVGGAPKNDFTGGNAGMVRIYRGHDGTVIRTSYGLNGYDEYGSAVACLGDVDGDGHADYAVGANLDDDAGTNSGSITVHSGPTGAQIWQWNGAIAGAQLGVSVAAAGDVDGDGRADVIGGAPFDKLAGVRTGSATVFSGRDGSILFRVYGYDPDDFFGQSVSGAGDVDGDGFADVMAGAPLAESFSYDVGIVDVYGLTIAPVLEFWTATGGSHGLDVDWIPDGGDPNAVTGTVVCSLGTPGALGLYGLSLARIDYLAFGYLPIMVSDLPVHLIESGGFGFDIAGSLVVPGASRQSPWLAGQGAYLQFFEISPVIQSSPGLRFQIVP